MSSVAMERVEMGFVFTNRNTWIIKRIQMPQMVFSGADTRRWPAGRANTRTTGRKHGRVVCRQADTEATCSGTRAACVRAAARTTTGRNGTGWARQTSYRATRGEVSVRPNPSLLSGTGRHGRQGDLQTRNPILHSGKVGYLPG
jgi:hypothetical protein